MHKLPAPPIHLITHQLDCIRCSHKFPVAEDSPYRRSIPARSNRWTALVQFHPDEHRRLMPAQRNRNRVPESHNIENEPGHEKHYLSGEEMHLYCPRCGADNRNWFYLKTQSKWRVWQQVRIFQFVGLLFIAFFIAMFAATITMVAGNHVKTAVFGTVLCLAGMLPLLIVPGQWKALRDYNYFRPLATEPSLLDSISPPIATFAGLSFTFIVFIPLCLYFIMPMGADALSYNTSQQAIVKLNELTEQMPTFVDNAEPAELRAVIHSFEDIQQQIGFYPAYPTPSPLSPPEQIKEWMNTILYQARLGVSSMEQVQLNKLMINLTDVENTFAGNPSFNFTKMVNFLKIWFKFVGLVSLICSLLAWLAVNHLVTSYDAHIPQPIYHSMSNMTRVGRWEANKALKAREVTEETVQWMDVQRNSIGGLSLTGLLRDRPHSPDTDKVRAQQYHVQTDRWCHIVEAHITDIMTPRTVVEVGVHVEPKVVHRVARTKQTHLRLS